MPGSLQSLTFGDRFNQSLETVTLPGSLQSLTFGDRFNQSLENVTLPGSLQSLTFGDDFEFDLNVPSTICLQTFERAGLLVSAKIDSAEKSSAGQVGICRINNKISRKLRKHI